jgi:hypothetical protein
MGCIWGSVDWHPADYPHHIPTVQVQYVQYKQSCKQQNRKELLYLEFVRLAEFGLGYQRATTKDRYTVVNRGQNK